jgi:uncharacterized membrane protein YtjA (UPF0391 family)
MERFMQACRKLTVHLRDMDVMGEPVQQSAGQPFRSERFRPFVEGQVAGDECCLSLQPALRTQRSRSLRTGPLSAVPNQQSCASDYARGQQAPLHLAAEAGRRLALADELHCSIREANKMLHWTLVFLVLALVAGLLGFAGIAGASAEIAKVLFFVFLVVWLISFITRRRTI